jgi:hypothetical protein
MKIIGISKKTPPIIASIINDMEKFTLIECKFSPDKFFGHHLGTYTGFIYFEEKKETSTGFKK